MAVNPDTVPVRLVHTTGPLDAPEGYTVPGNQEIQLSSVSATFDGSGAGGDFDPTLSIYSQDGQLLTRTKVGGTVTAGDSAVCTWIPFSRPKQTTPNPGATINALHLFDNSGTQVVPSDNDQAFHFAQVSSFDASVFAVHTTGGNVDRVTLKKQGVYAVFGWMNWDDAGEYSTWMYNLAPFGPTVTPMMMGITKDIGAFNGMFPTLSYTRTFPAALAGDTNPSSLEFWIGQDSGVDHSINEVYFDFQYLGVTDF